MKHPEQRWPTFIEITRVGKTGWCDIACYTWAVHWRKRMPLGLQPILDEPIWGLRREDWTPADVRATVPA